MAGTGVTPLQTSGSTESAATERREQPLPSGKPRRPRTLRFRLACLVLASIIPVCIIAGFVVNYAYQQKRTLTEQQVLQTARALSMVVDQQLATMQASAAALVPSHYLTTGNLEAFRQPAQDVLRDYPPGATFTLVDSTGQQLVNTHLSLGTPLPRRLNWDQVKTVFDTGKPTVLNLYKGVISKRTMVGVAVPVIRDGRVIYALALVVPASHFDVLLSQQRTPPGWIVAVHDANHVLVSRNQTPEKYVGTLALPEVRQRTSQSEEGVFESTNRDGVPVVTMFSRSPKSGWAALINIPQSVMLAGLRQWLWWAISGALLLLVIGTAMALALAERIARSIQALIPPAVALGAGAPVDVAPLDLAETDKVRQSLEDASQLLHQRTAERNRAEAALRSSQAKLQGVVGSAMDAIISVDEQQRIVVFNQAAVAVFQCAESEAIGSTLDRFLPAALREVHHEHIRRFRSSGVTNRSMHSPGILKGVRSNGEEFPVEATISQVQADGQKLFTVILRDITERKQAEESLQQSEQQFHELAEGIPQLAWTANPDGWIYWYNQRWYQYTGTTPQQMEGWGWQSVHDPDVLPLVMERWKASIATGESFDMVFPLRGADGAFRPFLTRVMPLRDTQGQVVRWFGTNTDISAQKQAEQALLRSEKLAALGRMAASISHEINNPLEAVTSVLYLVKGMNDLPESAKHYLEIADEELRRVVHIARQSLGFYRESNAPATTSVNTVLESAIDLLKSKFKAKQAIIDRQWHDDVEITAVAGELRQVFSNMLANSLDAIEQRGTIKLRVSAGKAPSNGHCCVRITIADSGQGIAASAQKHLFEPFFTTKGTIGTGLGLWVSKQIIDKHQGTIQVRSNTDGARHGTVFSIILPVEPAAASSQSAKA